MGGASSWPWDDEFWGVWGWVGLVTGTTLLGNDVRERLHLALGTSERSETALDELPGTLVLLSREKRGKVSPICPSDVAR